MNIHEMTEEECRAMLSRGNVVRLACALNNQPYIVPIHIDLEGDFLYGYATLGQKIEWMRQNPLVCLESDELVSHGQWASVIVSGRYEELPNTPEYAGERQVAERLFQRHPMWWEPASVPLPGDHPRRPIVFRVRIGRLTGRRASGPAGSPADVRWNRSETKTSWLTRVLRRVRGKWLAVAARRPGSAVSNVVPWRGEHPGRINASTG
jgi:uncharacterized protein